MKHFNYIILLLILLSGCIYFYRQKSIYESYCQAFSELNISNATELSKLRIYERNRSNETLYNGLLLEPDFTVTDTNGEEKTLSDIVKGNKLILRYSDLNCNTCIDEQIDCINQSIDQIGVENVVLFSTYEHYIHMQRFRKTNKIKFTIYKLNNDLDKKLADLGLPYFFILEENNFRINNMFISTSDVPQLTFTYLKQIKEKYFNM